MTLLVGPIYSHALLLRFLISDEDPEIETDPPDLELHAVEAILDACEADLSKVERERLTIDTVRKFATEPGKIFAVVLVATQDKKREKILKRALAVVIGGPESVT